MEDLKALLLEVAQHLAYDAEVNGSKYRQGATGTLRLADSPESLWGRITTCLNMSSEDLLSSMMPLRNVVATKEQLLARVPDQVRRFIEEEGVVDSLFQFGQCSRKIRYADNDYGFRTEGQVRQTFDELKGAWSNAVEIDYSPDGTRRIEILIKVSGT